MLAPIQSPAILMAERCLYSGKKYQFGIRLKPCLWQVKWRQLNGLGVPGAACDANTDNNALTFYMAGMKCSSKRTV
jgi:hypothetical protein